MKCREKFVISQITTFSLLDQTKCLAPFDRDEHSSRANVSETFQDMLDIVIIFDLEFSVDLIELFSLSGCTNCILPHQLRILDVDLHLDHQVSQQMQANDLVVNVLIVRVCKYTTPDHILDDVESLDALEVISLLHASSLDPSNRVNSSSLKIIMFIL